MVSIVRVKILAIFLGPIGYGIVFQFLNFLNIFTSTVHLGVPTGITAKIPSLMKDNEVVGKQIIDSYFVYFVKIYFTLTLLLTILFIFFSDNIVSFLIGETKYVDSFVLMVATAPFLVLYAIGDAFLRCYGKLTQIVFIAVVSSLSSILLLFPLLDLFGILGVSIYFLLNGILLFTIYAVLNFEKVKLIFRSNKIYKLDLRIQILKTGVVSLISSFLFIGSNIILRKFIIENLGLTENGIYQSVASLSASSFLVVYSYITTYLLPKISSSESDSQIVNETDVNFRFILLLMVPMIIAIFSFRKVLIGVLFSSEFLPASDILQYQFAGDFFRGLSGLFGLWMIYKMNLKVIIAFDVVMNLLLVSFPFACKHYFDYVSLNLIPISYMIALGIHFLLFFIYTKKKLRYRVSKSTFRTVLISVILLLAVFLVDKQNEIFKYVLSFFFILFFWFFAVSSIERNKLTVFLKNYLVTRFR